MSRYTYACESECHFPYISANIWVSSRLESTRKPRLPGFFIVVITSIILHFFYATRKGGPPPSPKCSIANPQSYKLLQCPAGHKSTTRVATLSYYILKERVKAREVFLAKKNVQPRFFRYLCVINRT